MNANSPRPSDVQDAIQARLSRYALSIVDGDIDGDVLHQAKVRLIDTLGALIAGHEGESATLARAIALGGAPVRAATIIGTANRVSPDMAAFANAIAARSAEMMDVYHYPGSFGGHPSDVVMPIFAAAESRQNSGADLLRAIVLGYEIFLRLSDAFHNNGFDDTNFACIATAASAGHLWGFSAAQMESAIAIAAVTNVILKQVRTDRLTAWKVIATGQAGRAGIFSAMLADTGVDGPSLPFEGKAGWSEHVAREKIQLNGLMPGERPTKILDTRIKHRAAAGETISSIIAAEQLAAQIDDVDEISSVSVELYERALVRAGTGEHHWHPRSRDAAGNSIPYLVSTTLREGTVGLGSYDQAHLDDSRHVRLMKKIRLLENPAFTAAYKRVPVEHRTRIVVTLQDGRTLTAETGGDQDDLSSPKSDAQIEEKFRRLADPSLGPLRARHLLEELWSIEKLADVSVIPQRLVIG